MDNRFILTSRGRALLAKIQAGEELKITKVGIGDGTPKSIEEMEGLNDLKNRRDVFQVNEVEVRDDGFAVVKALLTNEEVEERYFIREIGVFAMDGDDEILYCVCATGDSADLFSAKTDKSLQIALEIAITIGNAENVEIVISNSLTYAMKWELDDLAGVGRTTETVKKNADDILALKLKMMTIGNCCGGGGGGSGEFEDGDDNIILIDFSDLTEVEEFWGIWDDVNKRLIG